VGNNISYQTAEFGKFLQLGANTAFPPISVVRLSYPDNSSAFPENSAAKPLSSVDIYPKYAVLTHITNPEDISFTVYLSAEDVSVELGQIENDIQRVITLCNVMTAQNVELNGYVNDLEKNTFDTASAVDDVYYEVIKTNTLLGSVTANQATEITLEKTLSANSVYGTLSTQPLYVSTTNPVTSVNTVVTNTVGVSAINLPVTVLNTIETVTTPEATQLDAFGRLRISTPVTLFDSSHRYRDNNLWASLTAVSASYAFNQNQGLMELNVSGLSGASVIRETTKVFSYQPGKSLLVMNTFVMASSATNLRQRVGYFGQDNGIYFQLDDGVMSFVERTLVNGSPSTEIIVPVSAWNGDKLNGTGPSGFTLDITKAQILWTDIEWLGLGTVRTGFVIDGKFIVCHSFHHANRIASTYITTASLPLRYEIVNKGPTSGSKTLKQVCSTVISEGGYELRGLQQAVNTPITAPVDLPSPAGTYYPVISIRLKSSPNRLDAIVIMAALSIMGIGNGPEYSWQVRASATTSGGTWVDAGVDSAVEYKIDGGTVSGGRILASGFFSSSNQSSVSVDILKEALFKFQLERNTFTGTPYELTLVCATNSGGADVFASMDWEEISR
jgi:hypothetical protein